MSDKEQSSYIKPFVDEFEQQIMFAEKSWGSFQVMDVEKSSMTIKVTLNPGHSMNYPLAGKTLHLNLLFLLHHSIVKGDFRLCLIAVKKSGIV